LAIWRESAPEAIRKKWLTVDPAELDRVVIVEEEEMTPDADGAAPSETEAATTEEDTEASTATASSESTTDETIADNNTDASEADNAEESASTANYARRRRMRR
jgi:hypothetical protein